LGIYQKPEEQGTSGETPPQTTTGQYSQVGNFSVPVHWAVLPLAREPRGAKGCSHLSSPHYLALGILVPCLPL